MVEEAEKGYERFRRMFEAFQHISARSRRDHYNFKVLLTLPQQTSEDWEQLDDGDIVVVNLPPKGNRA
jgi:hypothetical protein